MMTRHWPPPRRTHCLGSVLGTLTVAVAVGLPALPCPAEGQSTESLEDLAEAAVPAVVLIDVETPSGSRQGSGFLVDPSGRILTNEHVVRDALGARVKLASGDVYDLVTVLATDPRRDLAVIQVPGFELPALPLGNSDSVRIGNSVVLIGHPLGLENTVTTGVVSGRRQEPEGFQLLQISAPASRGSSGGPVLSTGGEVVGVASSQMQTGQNLNFAVPINYARGLLMHSSGEPLAVLRPEEARAENRPVPTSSETEAVNQGLRFDLEGFGGFSAEMLGRTGMDQRRRTRITYRRIETVGGGEPRIERYVESETTRRGGPFGTEETIRRERVRTLVRSDDLQPISTRGEVAWSAGDGWERAEYDLRFTGYRVQGLVSDSTGRTREVDRELPRGVLLREVADLAFATLASDSLMGRSVDLVTFDPFDADVASDRYDVHEVETLNVAGEEYRGLRVSIARDLSNTTAWFTVEQPRILLRREAGGSDETETLMQLVVYQR